MNLAGAISILSLSAAVLLGGEVLAAETQGPAVDPAVTPRLDLDPVVHGPKTKPPVAVDPSPVNTLESAGGVAGTVGGGSGGQLPGGIPLPEPKKICPHGKTCAE